MPDPYDVLTVAAVAAELRATIGNGRIQRIGLIDPRTVGAEIYAGRQRHYLIASADDRNPRLRLAAEMPSLDPALVTPFGLLLRKHLRGATIHEIEQPPLERLVRFSIVRRQAHLTARGAALPSADHEDQDEDDHTGDGVWRELTLYVELMGRHSNLILVDDAGLIMESAKRVTPQMSRVRQILPRRPYSPPPPPDRLDPREINPAGAARLLASVPPDANIATAIVGAYRGISPTLAREIVYRATGDHDTRAGRVEPDAAAALARETLALLDVLRTGAWAPRVYISREGDAGDVVAFAPLPMRHLAVGHEERVVTSVSEGLALSEVAATRPDPGRHAQRRQRLLRAIAAAREKAERKLASLAAEAVRATEAERLKTSGELIYAHLWQMAPGQTALDVDGMRIALDPALTAAENAQAYFERYRKAQSAGAHLPALEAASRTELAYLDQLATLVAQAPGFAELETLAAEWGDLQTPASGTSPKRKKAPGRPKPLRDAEGNSIYVGRSGPQNDLVTFDVAGPDDTWLHARGVAGSHVVIRWQTPGEAENLETVTAAAALAAWYSAARESNRVEVDVARRRHVRKIKGAGAGMVTYRHERTIRVQPAPETALRDVLTEP